jgi:hypothetical protein
MGECQAHVDRVKARWPDAFVTTTPNDTVRDWLVNPTTKTLSIDVVPPPAGPTTEEVYNQAMQNSKVLKALALALNDGSIVPGSNMTNAALKAAIKAKM